MKVPTVEPANQTSEQVLTAVEKTLAAHNLRLKPNETLDGIIAVMRDKYQVELDAEHGYLNASQHGQPAHLNRVIEGLAAQETARFFPREVGNVTNRDELDREGKIKYIAEHGLESWEKLPQKASAAPVVLDKRRMTRKEWLSLDRATKTSLCNQFSNADIAAIMSRT